MIEDQQRIREVKRKYEPEWLSIKGVVGIGIGTLSDDSIGIIVSVKKLEKKIQKEIPDQVEGVKVEIQESGEFKAF
jgi:hypothetical protein